MQVQKCVRIVKLPQYRVTSFLKSLSTHTPVPAPVESSTSSPSSAGDGSILCQGVSSRKHSFSLFLKRPLDDSINSNLPSDLFSKELARIVLPASFPRILYENESLNEYLQRTIAGNHENVTVSPLLVWVHGRASSALTYFSESAMNRLLLNHCHDDESDENQNQDGYDTYIHILMHV